MDTRPVRFEFHLRGGAEELKFIHNIPSSLVNGQPQAAQTDAQYISRFATAIQPILKVHEAACRDASERFCENCGQLSAGVLQTPMSWLDNTKDPFVTI